MANHSPEPDNYTEKKTFSEAIGDAAPSEKKTAKKDTSDKGAAAKNGGGDK